ncbi:MAG: aldo/keto reductase [Chloroflexota bacterium]|nr:aldo/keto reductase [Chloroflexota bacterium]
MMTETLNKRTLGKSGIQVTELGMGLWAAGGDEWGTTDDEQILQAIDFALDSGVNFFDTSDVYGMGHSEKLLGRAMQGRRDQFVVATKIGWRNFDDEHGRSAYDTVDKLIAGVESNLRRLQTDYIDVMQSHIDFRDPTMEIFLEGFQTLQQQGKIRAYGVSTSDFEYLKQFNHDGNCSTLQIDYSILNRTPEAEIFPYCQEHNIGVIVRGALAMGILTGKFTPDTHFEEGDFRQNWQNNPEERRIFLNDLEKVEQLHPLAEGRTLTQLALQFTLSHPAVSTTIPGAKNVRQMRENIRAATLPPLAEEELRQIDEITPPGGGRKIWPA